jgi:outer membrane lipase/esterase
VELDDYVESNRNFTAMGYYDQKVDSTVGRIGWQVRLRVSRFEPYAQITYDQEFEGSKQANAWLQTVPGAGPYRVPGLAFDRYYVTALLGVRVVLGDVSASIGVTTTTLQREAQDGSLFASFSGNY